MVADAGDGALMRPLMRCGTERSSPLHLRRWGLLWRTAWRLGRSWLLGKKVPLETYTVHPDDAFVQGPVHITLTTIGQLGGWCFDWLGRRISGSDGALRFLCVHYVESQQHAERTCWVTLSQISNGVVCTTLRPRLFAEFDGVRLTTSPQKTDLR